jgi:hypothetical protein
MPSPTFEPEQSVLGAILARPELLPQVMEILDPEDFHPEALKCIYQAMEDIHYRGDPADVVTVTAILKERDHLKDLEGGPAFLSGLQEQVGFAVNVKYYAQIVKKRSILRQLKELGQRLIQEGSKEDANATDLLLFLESKVHDISSRNGFHAHLDIHKAIPEIGEFLKIEPPPRKIHLDPWLKEASINLITGWRGVGKTAFSLGLLNAVSQGDAFGPYGAGEPVPCLYFDAEMTQQDLKDRCEEIYIRRRRSEKLYIFSDHHCSLLGMPTADLLDEKWRRWMKEEVLLKLGVKLWVLDNIGSVTPGLDENSREAWSPINRWLLDLRFLGIATILAHHEGKSGTQRGTSAREDNLDISIALKKPADYRPEDGARFILHFEKARVQQKYLHLLAATEFQQVLDPEGKAIWTFSNLKVENKVKVLKMLDEGIPAKEVAELVGVSKGRVSQIKADAVKEGLLTDKGKLTPSGFQYIQGG